MNTNKRGVSLIVLVITIIVLAILAATVIITITNVGLINSAGDSVDQHELSQLRDVAAVAWMEAVLDSDITTDDEYIEYITTYLKGAGYTDKILSKYTITADENSVTVNIKGEAGDEGNDSENEPPEISLTLDKTEIEKEITVGSSETETLVATLTNATGNLTWTTSDNTVVEVVGNGEMATITFVGKGIATITVSYGDGTITARCEVSVTEKGNSNLISFTIDGVEYQAEQEMNWKQWISSSYKGQLNITLKESLTTQFRAGIVKIDEKELIDSNKFEQYGLDPIREGGAYITQEY